MCNFPFFSGIVFGRFWYQHFTSLIKQRGEHAPVLSHFSSPVESTRPNNLSLKVLDNSL